MGICSINNKKEISSLKHSDSETSSGRITPLSELEEIKIKNSTENNISNEDYIKYIQKVYKEEHKKIN